MNFYAPYTGYYHFRWTPVADQYGNAGTWLEVVFGHIKIQQGTASAKSSNLFGETTAIGSIRATDEKQAEVWYNLQGQRVSAPQKGIYIRNGKKVLCP